MLVGEGGESVQGWGGVEGRQEGGTLATARAKQHQCKQCLPGGRQPGVTARSWHQGSRPKPPGLRLHSLGSTEGTDDKAPLGRRPGGTAPASQVGSTESTDDAATCRMHPSPPAPSSLPLDATRLPRRTRPRGGHADRLLALQDLINRVRAAAVDLQQCPQKKERRVAKTPVVDRQQRE